MLRAIGQWGGMPPRSQTAHDLITLVDTKEGSKKTSMVVIRWGLARNEHSYPLLRGLYKCKLLLPKWKRSLTGKKTTNKPKKNPPKGKLQLHKNTSKILPTSPLLLPPIAFPARKNSKTAIMRDLLSPDFVCLVAGFSVDKRSSGGIKF